MTFAQQYLHYGITLATLKKYKKRAARFVFNNYTDRTPGCVTKMVESLKWEKLEERRKTNRLCMLYKIKNGLIEIDSHQYISNPTTAGLEAKITSIKKERAVRPSVICSSSRPTGTGTNCQRIQLRPTQ